jgi:protein-S-isoprenylcysteine O-methyltransferase Ste14
MIIVYTIGFKPVILVKLAAIMDGLLLTPLQAVCVGIGLFFVMPRLFSRNVSRILQPNWIFGLGLLLAFLVFGYFCIYQIPSIF